MAAVPKEINNQCDNLLKSSSKITLNGDSQKYKTVTPSEAAEEKATNSIDKPEKESRLRIWKNIIAIAVSFMSLYSSYLVVAVLQSSLNKEGGLGMISQAVIYVAQIVSSMFIPAWMIDKLGLKWTMVVSQLGYSIYIAAQFYPSFATFIPAAIIAGLSAAPLISAQASYFTQAGIRYAKLNGVSAPDPGPVIAKFFGVFFMIFQTCIVWGNLIIAIVFSRRNSTNNGTSTENEDYNNNNNILDHCGSQYCSYSKSPKTNTTSNNENSTSDAEPLYLLFGILLFFSLLASVIIAVLVDSGPLEKCKPDKRATVSGWSLVMATLRHTKNPYQLLMIPLTLFSGLNFAFLTADFSAAFVVCALGLPQLGYIFICYGLIGAIGSITCGFLVKRIGRLPLFILGTVIAMGIYLSLLFFWSPDPLKPTIFYVISTLWALCNSVWDTQLYSFYGIVFQEQKVAAFSNFRLWQSLGYAIAFGSSMFLCVNSKLYLLICTLLMGISGYLIIEFHQIRKSKKERK